MRGIEDNKKVYPLALGQWWRRTTDGAVAMTDYLWINGSEVAIDLRYAHDARLLVKVPLRDLLLGNDWEPVDPEAPLRPMSPNEATRLASQAPKKPAPDAIEDAAIVERVAKLERDLGWAFDRIRELRSGPTRYK
jgi:hypothetical protein